eukprot:364779-Chlamydomonas_euryale.AAC.22
MTPLAIAVHAGKWPSREGQPLFCSMPGMGGSALQQAATQPNKTLAQFSVPPSSTKHRLSRTSLGQRVRAHKHLHLIAARQYTRSVGMGCSKRGLAKLCVAPSVVQHGLAELSAAPIDSTLCGAICRLSRWFMLPHTFDKAAIALADAAQTFDNAAIALADAAQTFDNAAIAPADVAQTLTMPLSHPLMLRRARRAGAGAHKEAGRLRVEGGCISPRRRHVAALVADVSLTAVNLALNPGCCETREQSILITTHGPLLRP